MTVCLAYEGIFPIQNVFILTVSGSFDEAIIESDLILLFSVVTLKLLAQGLRGILFPVCSQFPIEYLATWLNQSMQYSVFDSADLWSR